MPARKNLDTSNDGARVKTLRHLLRGKKQPRAVLHLDLDAPVLYAAFGTITASQDMSATAIRQWVRQTAQRLEDELAEEQDIFILAATETGSAFGSGRPAYRWNRPRSCPCKDQRSRGDGWFEVIVRESMSRDGESSKCFGFVNRYGSTDA